MEWERHQKAAPGQRTLASPGGGIGSAALARLEPQRPPARLHAAHSTATHRGEPLTTRRCFAAHRGRDPFSRAHTRLAWVQRLARNARPETSGQVTIRLFGTPESLAASLGLATA